MMLVKDIASRRNPTLWESILTSMQRAVEAFLEQASKGIEPNTSEGLLSLDHGQFEEIAIQILSSYSTYYDWKKDVSCRNEYGQTLAHLAVTLGYIRLLEQLISWEIDLSVRDTTGATALHFAYLYNHPECVSLLTRSGTNQQIHDEPGRQAYAMTSGASFNETLGDSSDFTSERSASITDREETFDILTPSGAPKLQNGMPTSAQIEDSDLVAKQILLEAVPAEATRMSSQMATLPTADMTSPRDKGCIIQELDNVEAGATMQSAGVASQGSSRQMPLLCGTPILTSQLSPNMPIPIISPDQPSPIIPLAVVASPPQSPVSSPYNPPPNQTPSLAKKPVGNFLHSLLGAKQIKSPETHLTGLVLKAPKSRPLEPYEFREMTLGCRFGTSPKIHSTTPMMLMNPFLL